VAYFLSGHPVLGLSETTALHTTQGYSLFTSYGWCTLTIGPYTKQE